MAQRQPRPSSEGRNKKLKWLPNPYAIAQLLANAPDITSIIRSGGKAADAFLLDTLVKGRRQKTMTSALVVFRQVAELFDRPVTLSQAIDKSKEIWAREGYTVDEFARVLPSIAPIADTVSSDSFADSDDLIEDSVSYLDPVQGTVGDCYLISAMIALAWAKKGLLTARLNAAGFAPPGKPSFEWKFHDDTGASNGHIDVSGRIRMSGNTPLYARSSSPVEDWPSLVEKAYVVKVCGANVAQPEPSEANYKSIDAKNEGSLPERACQALLGGTMDGELLDTVDGHQIFLQGGRLQTASGTMSKPVMASTKVEEDMEAVNPNDPDLWKTTGLFARHAYAVLGVMLSNNTVKHVVLRNPHGADTDPDRDGYHNGPWHPANRPTVPLNQNGVFAIPRKMFYDYFKDIGWVDH